jgi:hypothetical protein
MESQISNDEVLDLDPPYTVGILVTTTMDRDMLNTQQKFPSACLLCVQFYFIFYNLGDIRLQIDVLIFIDIF